MDRSINLDELKSQLDARRTTPSQAIGDEEETPVVGSNFFDRLNGIDTNSAVVKHNYSPETIMVNDKFNPEDEGKYVTTNTTETVVETNYNTNNSYRGPGLVINNDELSDNTVHQGPKYGVGLNPNVVDALDSYMQEMDSEIEELKERHEEILETNPEARKSEENDDEEETNGMTKDEFNQKYEEAVVVIDKSGFGRVINFTDEEHEKLEKVKKIKLEEIENISLDTIKTKKPKKKDIDKIIKRITNVTTTNIVLPISGYTAEIKGCSAYELISLIDGNENALLNAQNKWSLIHNKIENTSIGKMDFNEFLLNTASNDYNTFIYGLLCSTYPDDDTIPLTCDKCKKNFDHRYSVKSLIRAEAMEEKLQDTIMHVVDSSVSEKAAKQAHKDALISKVKRVRLPHSGIIAEIYVQSAYDLINKSIKDLTDNTDEKYAQTAVISTLINAFYIPDPDEDGSYFEVNTGADISKTIYTLNEVDVMIIRKLGEDLLDNMAISYGLMNVTCPHCGNYIPFIPMELENILFYRYRQALNTVID